MLAKVGIDVSKKKFDVTLLVPDKGKRRKTLANTETGIKQLHEWLTKLGITQGHICMEATSVYWENLAETLTELGHQVSVVNPARIKGFAMSELRRNKTDALDADVIAEFCAQRNPAVWQPPSAEQKQLRALVRYRQDLVQTRTSYLNRLETCRDTGVGQHLETLIEVLNQQISQVEEEIKQLINQHPALKEKKELLLSIKGFGEVTVHQFLAEMYDLEHYEDANAAAADVGLTPSHYQSGSSVKKRSTVSRIGKKNLRTALYFPAITAILHNPLIRKFVQRLQAKNKHKAVIRTAVMRKLVHLAYGVLKHGKPFDPNYGCRT